MLVLVVEKTEKWKEKNGDRVAQQNRREQHSLRHDPFYRQRHTNNTRV